MNKYEATFVFVNDLQLYENAKNELKKDFENHQIKILKEEEKGDQPLAYPIKKNQRGRYIYFELEAPTQNINLLDKTLRLKSGILRHLFIRV